MCLIWQCVYNANHNKLYDIERLAINENIKKISLYILVEVIDAVGIKVKLIYNVDL